MSIATSDKSAVKSQLNARNGFTDLDLRFKPHPNFGDLVPLKDVAAIRGSIRNILLTRPGERPFQPTLGCSLQDYLFEPAGPITEAAMREVIHNAITIHEPRVFIKELDLFYVADSGNYTLNLSLQIINTQQVVDIQLYLERTR